jgi:DNA-binding LacI/PurR family transcriptional regulator
MSGFVVDYWGVGNPERLQNFRSLLALLYASKKPIAVIDSVGDLELPEPLRSSKRVRILTIAARAAGEEMGRHLMTMGHRNAAFLTLRGNLLWSQRRYDGLKRAFSDAALPGSVVPYETIPFPDNPTLVCAAARLSSKEISILFSKERQRELAQSLSAFEQAGTVINLDQPGIERIRRQALTAVDLCRATDDRSLADANRDNLFSLIGGKLLLQALSPLFEKLLYNTAITAWISATDGTALAAKVFLRGKDIDVPGRISVCGFDNSIQADIGNLTSYEFDHSGIFYQALSFAAGRIDYRAAQDRVVEWPGMVVARASTGRVRRMQHPDPQAGGVIN